MADTFTHHTNENLADQGHKELDDFFALAEATISKAETSGVSHLLPKEMVLSAIQAIWGKLYPSAIGTFIYSLKNSYEGGGVSAEDYKEIEPLFDKWKEVAQGIGNDADQQVYEDFLSDLREFSKQYPDWFGEQDAEAFFLEKIWSPHFEPYATRGSELSSRLEAILVRSAGRTQAMLATHFALISPYDFEKFIAELFVKMGYLVEVTPKACDYGVDVIAKNGGEVIAIQVKKYSVGNNVGNRDVQRLLGAMQLRHRG